MEEMMCKKEKAPSTRNFYQQKYTIKGSLEREYLKKGIMSYNLVDPKFFYRVSDTRIMMAICHTAGKNRGRYDVVYYNGAMDSDNLVFVIRDAEPVEAPIWFDNEALFKEFIAKEGLADARFTPSPTCEKNIPVLMLDDSIPMLWEDFKELDKEHLKKDCWVAEYTDAYTDETYTTEGDIHKNTTWKDYFEWLVGDIEEVVGEDELSGIVITGVYYNGIDDEGHFL